MLPGLIPPSVYDEILQKYVLWTELNNHKWLEERIIKHQWRDISEARGPDLGQGLIFSSAKAFILRELPAFFASILHL